MPLEMSRASAEMSRCAHLADSLPPSITLNAKRKPEVVMMPMKQGKLDAHTHTQTLHVLMFNR